uniref:Bm7776, isoform a n=1 Tax=Brugia malayi TaxID=6279 RepID=A0A1I9G627_BRUMA|nr:Bm7776, isoform a [Brugia malayi]
MLANCYWQLDHQGRSRKEGVSLEMFRLVRRHGDVDIVVLVHCDGPLRLANRSTSKFSEGTNTSIFYDFTCAKLASPSLEGISRAEKCERRRDACDTGDGWALGRRLETGAGLGIRGGGAGVRKIRKMGGHWKVQGGSRSADGVTLTQLTLMEFFLYISRADEA